MSNSSKLNKEQLRSNFQAITVNGILKSQDKNNDGYVDYFEFSKAQEERNAKTENQT